MQMVFMIDVVNAHSIYTQKDDNVKGCLVSFISS